MPPKKRSRSPDKTDPQAKKNKKDNFQIIFKIAQNNSPKHNGDNSDKSESHHASPMKIDNKKEKKISSDLFLKNISSIRRDILREQGYEFVEQAASDEISQERLKLFLDKVVESSMNIPKGNTPEKLIDILCYYLLGSHGRFGLYYYENSRDAIEHNGGLISRFIMSSKWPLVDFALDYLHQYMKKSSLPHCAKYPKEKLLSFIGKSMIVACSALQCQRYRQRKPSEVLNICSKIYKFFEKYNININLVTKLPKPFGDNSDGYVSRYDGRDPLVLLLNNLDINLDYIKLAQELGSTITLKHMQILLDNFAKYYNNKTINSILELLIDNLDENSKKIPLELFFNQDVDKRIILKLRQPSIKHTFSGDLLKFRQYALHYGLADIYEGCHKRLMAKDKLYLDNLDFANQAVIILMKSKHFDEDSVKLLAEELQRNPNIIKHPDFFNVFNAWFSYFILDNPDENSVSNSKGYMSIDNLLDNNPRPRPKYYRTLSSITKEAASELIKLLAELFQELKSIQSQQQSNSQNLLPSLELTLLQNCFYSGIEADYLSQILDAMLPKRNASQKQNKEYTTLLRDAFNYLLRMPKEWGVMRSSSFLIIIHLVQCGADLSVLLLELTLDLYGAQALKINQEALQYINNFLKSAEIQSRLDNIISNKAFAALATKGSHIDFTNALKFMLGFCKPDFVPDWNLMLTAHLTSLNAQVKSLGTEAKSLEITKFLLQQNGQRYPEKIVLTTGNRCSALEYIALLNRSSKMKNLFIQHEKFLLGLYELPMKEAILMAERQRSLENVIGMGSNHFTHSFRGRLQAAIVDQLAVRMDNFLKKKEDDPSKRDISQEDFFLELSHKLSTLWISLIKGETQIYFTKRYNFDTSPSSQNQLKMVMDAFLTNLSTQFLTDIKRDNEIWQNKSLRAYSFFKRVAEKSRMQKCESLLLNNIIMLIYALKDNRAALILLIDALVDIDAHYNNLYLGGKTLEYSQFLDYLVRLSWALPGFSKCPAFINGHINIIHQQLTNLYLQSDKSIQDQLQVYAAQKGCIDPDFINKNKSVILKAVELEQDLTFGYLSKKMIEEMLSGSLNVQVYNIFEDLEKLKRDSSMGKQNSESMSISMSISQSEMQPSLSITPSLQLSRMGQLNLESEASNGMQTSPTNRGIQNS